MDEVVVVDYDLAWPTRFNEEKARILVALDGAMEGVVAIEHVGSTAVPGLAAKPIIDMMIGVHDLSAGERAVEPMASLGYEYLGENGIPDRLYFRKGNPRTHHVHMVRHGGEFWERHVLFRDLLRERPDIAARYGVLKKDLAIKHRTQRLEYTEAKSPFIEEALAKARRELKTPGAPRNPAPHA